MPFQNRVTPWGDIVVNPSRGLFFGNRGGRIHTAEKRLSNRRWASRAWICCVLEFKNRQREIMSANSYTELFFLDEVTALAAGHRPCFECRRHDAVAFFECHAEANGLPARVSAPDYDRLMQAARLEGRRQRTTTTPIDQLPDGSMIRLDDSVWALRSDRMFEWSFEGYQKIRTRPKNQTVELLTPTPVAEALSFGYKPVFHPTADQPVGR